MWWIILAVIAVLILAAAVMDRRTRRSGHRVPNGHDLNRRIPQGSVDNSRTGGQGNPIVRSRFGEVSDDTATRGPKR